MVQVLEGYYLGLGYIEIIRSINFIYPTMYVRLGPMVSEFVFFGFNFRQVSWSFCVVVMWLRAVEPTKWVLQTFPPILSLSSVIILKSLPVIVLCMFVIYLLKF